MPVPLEVQVRSRSFRWALLVTALVGLASAVFAFLPDVSRWERIGAAALAVMCAVLTVGGLRTLIGRLPLFVLRDEGIDHRWMGLVPWDDVEQIRVFSAGGNLMLGIELRDAGRYVGRIPSLPARLLARLNPVFRHPTLSVPVTLTELSAEELVAEMEARARRPLGPGHHSDMSGV